MKKDVDIFGACTVRDAFEISPILKNKYQVKKFIQNNSPLTLGYDPIDKLDITITKEHFSLTPLCWYKWFRLNANEEVFSYLADNKSEYLILNLTEVSYSFIEINKEGTIVRLCNQFGITKNHVNSLFPTYKEINPLNLDFNEVKEHIILFAQKIKDIYTEDKIIFIKNFPAEYYISKFDNFLHKFDNKSFKETNWFLSRVYEIFIECFECLYIIEVPSNSLGWKEHKWGLANQHYINDIYEYIGECVDYIISNTTSINKYYIDYNLLIKQLKFTNQNIAKFQDYILYESPFSEFCLRYSCIRILILAQDNHDKVFTISNINNGSEYTPLWVKNGYSKIITSDCGNLHFKVNSLNKCTLKIYFQSLDSRSKNGMRYEIKIRIRSIFIDGNLINNSNDLIVSHDNPFIIEYNTDLDKEYQFSIIFEPFYYS